MGNNKTGKELWVTSDGSAFQEGKNDKMYYIHFRHGFGAYVHTGERICKRSA